MLTVLTIEGIAQPTDLPPAPYVINTYDHTPGLHYEQLGQLRLFNKKWKIVTVLDLFLFKKRFNDINNIFRQSLEICQSNNPDVDIIRESCKFFNTTGRYKLFKMEQTLSQVEHLTGSSKRVRRGWFDFVGKGAKILFGVMNQDDADFYSEKIKDVTNGEKNVIHIITEQTTIMKSTLHNMNSTIADLIHNEITLENALKKAHDEQRRRDGKVQLKFDFEDQINRFNVVTEQFQFELITIVNIILDAKAGILHPAVISPSRLVSQLKDVQSNIPHGLSFPVPLDIEHTHQLLNCLTLEIFYENDKLVYVANLPLLEAHLFYLYKINHFPVKSHDNVFIMIEPTQNFLAIDENKQQYLYLSEMEYQNCIKLDANKVICSQTRPILLAHLNDVCEVQLYLSSEKIPKSCDTRIIELTRTIFIQLISSNTWLFTSNYGESLSVACTHHEHPIDLILKGTGSITLDGRCRGYGRSAMLIPKSTITMITIPSEFVPALDIQEDCCEQLKQKTINITHIPWNLNLKPMQHHIEDLNIASHRLRDLERMTNEAATEATNRKVSFSIVGAIVAVLVMGCAAYKIYKKFCAPNNCCGLKGLCIKVEQNVHAREVVRYNDDEHSVCFPQSNKEPEPEDTNHSTGRIGYRYRQRIE